MCPSGAPSLKSSCPQAWVAGYVPGDPGALEVRSRRGAIQIHVYLYHLYL